MLDIVETPGFLQRVNELGERFESGFAGLGLELRRRGLFMGLKLPGQDDGLIATKDLIDAGVFAIFANNDTSVVQLLPPLTITDDEADDIISIVSATLGRPPP